MDTRNKYGQFTIGRIEPTEIKLKRCNSIKNAWKTRHDYHGMYNTKFYNSWRSMTTRCRGTCGKESIKKYRDRCITVCERWLDFKNFYTDMYPTYIDGLTIDRINNNGNYEPSNCRWATIEQQAYNKRNTVRIDYNGENLTLPEWSKKLGIGINSLKLRYFRRYVKGKITIKELMEFKPKKYEHIL